MSRKPEQKVYDRAKLSVVGHGLWLQRLENAVASGMPDTFLINMNGVTVWIENKAVEGWPVRPDTPVLGDKKGLRTSQRSWFREAIRRNVPAFVLLGIDDQIYYLPAFVGELCVNQFTRAQIEKYAAFTTFSAFYKFARQL